MSAHPIMQTHSTGRHARTLAAMAMVVGAYGLWSLAQQVLAESWPIDAAAWLSLTTFMAQIGLALLGGIWLWQGHRRGAGLLFVLSCSSLPALSSFVEYLSTLGLGLYAQVVITGQGGGLQSGFLYGVATQVAIDPAPSEHVIGINLAALVMMAWSRRHMV